VLASEMSEAGGGISRRKWHAIVTPVDNSLFRQSLLLYRNVSHGRMLTRAHTAARSRINNSQHNIHRGAKNAPFYFCNNCVVSARCAGTLSCWTQL